MIFLKSIDIRYDKGCITVQETGILKETNKKYLKKSNEVIMVKEITKMAKRLLEINVGNMKYL